LRRLLVLLAAGAFLLHAIQGVLLPTPWLLPDELHASDAARESARNGYASGWALLTWPLWVVGTGFGYAATKLLGAAAVASAALPTFALARLVAERRASLLAAAGAVLAPTTILASTAHPAAVAYPIAAAATYFVVRGDVRIAALFGALAVFIWPTLFPVALSVSVLVYVRRVGPRRLLEWPYGGMVIVVAGAFYAWLEIGRGASDAFRRATDAWEKVPASAGAAFGALAIGLALVPVVVAAAALVRRPQGASAWSPLVAVGAGELVASIVVAALLDLGRPGGGPDEVALLTTLPPLLAVAAGAFGRVDRRALAVGVVVVAIGVLLVAEPDAHAPGTALADALGLSPRVYAIVAALAVLNVVVAFRLLRRRRVALALAIVVAALVIPGELAAWADARDVPTVDGVEDLAAGRPVTVLPAATAPGVLEGFLFWTPSASVADPPLELRSVDPPTGTFTPPLPPGLAFDFAGARVAGRLVGRTSDGVLVDTGPVARAAETVEGLYADSWSSGDAYYRRFGGAPIPGVLLVNISRASWRGPSKPAQVVVSVKPMGGEPFAERITSIDSGEERVVRLPVPPPPFEVKVAIGPTFSPADYGLVDGRQLGAKLTFDYRPSRS
jgi:hypothetical protein